MQIEQIIKPVSRKNNIFMDGIGYTEHWDFSRANLNEETRIMAITQVASICYQSPKALGSENLYNRLAAESIGLPSSSFEFVPVLLDKENPFHQEVLSPEFCNAKKFGEEIGDRYVLTNYRALFYDWEMHPERYGSDIREIYNTEEEAAIIKEHFKVFLFKVDLPTRSQMVRHRTIWQELSRRYVDGKRVPFDFYISENMKNVVSEGGTTEEIIELCVKHYMAAREAGVKPQDARRIIPQAAYTQIWGAFPPSYLKNFFKLRADSHAQWEIRQVAYAMKELAGLAA